MTSKLRTCLWFESGGLDAARFYVSLFPDSAIEAEHALGQETPVLVDFTLMGAPFQILNGGPHFTLNEAASISVVVDEQADIDRLWEALLSGGGEERQCGWLKDRWGVFWQIYPAVLIAMQSSEDGAAAERARQAMYQMKKLDVAALQKAFIGG